MNLLLAGASGFIGSFLYSKLFKNYSVKALNHRNQNVSDNFYSINLTKESDVEKFVEESPQYDILIFLVGLAHKKGRGKEIDDFLLINNNTLINLLSILKSQNKSPKKIIFSSTISVYGEQYDQRIYEEDSPKLPLSPYAISKMKAEQYLLDNYKEKTWILRFAPVYSSKFLLNINRRTKIRCHFYKVGRGNFKLSLCNIENIGFAIEGIIKNKVPVGVYNISDSKNYTYEELLKWQRIKWSYSIPLFSVKILYYLGNITNNTFLSENTIKLISDNVYPSDKICSYIDFPSTIYDVKYYHDQ